MADDSESKRTTDHDTIRRWIEERGGRPAHVKGTGGGDDDAGLLRIDFGEPEENLEEVSWDEFFQTFDENDLEFLYQEQTKDGGTSRFSKFVSRGS